MSSLFNSLSMSQLHTLVTILEVRNLSKAAIVLESSQSVLSRHLAQFRDALNDPLMIRQGREYILTERAKEILEPLKQALAELERIRLPITFNCERKFTLAASDYVAENMLPSLMADLAKVAPKVKVDYITWQANHFSWLSNGEVDLAISMLDDAPDEYHGRVIGEDIAVCCMRHDHPLSQLPTIDEVGYLAWPHIKITGGGIKMVLLIAILKIKA
jgi:DNA-binding transcriptional LysR family regulator